MTTEVFESVWHALEDTPTEAENMKLRSSLMIAITEAVSAWHVTQMEAARRLGVTQPRLNDLLRGRIAELGGVVEQGTELTGLRDDVHGVTASVRDTAGRPRPKVNVVGD